MAQRETGNQQKRLFARAANQQQAKDKGQMVVTGDNMLDTEPKMARKIFAKCHAAGNRAIGIGEMRCMRWVAVKSISVPSNSGFSCKERRAKCTWLRAKLKKA